MPRSARVILALVAALATAAALAACGGGDSSGADAKQLLKQTFSGNHEIKSGKLVVKLNIDAQGAAGTRGPIAVALTGPFESQGKGKIPQFDLAAQIQASGQNIQAGAVTDGSQGWLKFNNQAYVIPAKVWDQFVAGYTQAQQRSNRQNRSLGTLKNLGIDPEKWLSNPKVEGDADVGGVQTTQISADVDVSQLLASVNALASKARALGGQQLSQLPQGVSAAQRKKVADAVKDASVDVYTGKDDKTLRKMAVDVTIRPTSGGVKEAKVAFSLEIDDLNAPQTITPPANAKPLSDLTSQLGGLGALGGGGAGGATGGSGSGSSGGASGDAQQKVQQYTQCLQAAGNDVAKAQRCAALLNSGG